MITAIVIMAVTLVISPIPKILQFLLCQLLFAIYFFQEIWVNFLAIAAFTVGVHLEGTVDHILLGGNDVHQIPQLLAIEGGSIDVNVYPTGVVDKGTILSQLAHKCLHRGNVLIATNGADHLRLIL